jgi:hypothetical protein
MKSYDRSLEEVWEWKEQVYEQVKGFSPAEYIDKIGKDAGSILNEYGVTLCVTQRNGMRSSNAGIAVCAENDVEYNGKAEKALDGR